MFTQGTLMHSVWRGVMAAIAFAVPVALMHSGAWQELTVGGLLMVLLHYAESQMTQ